MKGIELINKLKELSEEELNQEVYFCGDDCLVHQITSVDIAEEAFIDEDDGLLPAGSIVID